MYGSWDMECDKTVFFVILDHPFTYLTTQKIKILKKWKLTAWDIIILHMCTINGNHICTVPEIWSVTDRIFSHFGPFFALLHSSPLQQPLTAWNMKKSKKWKNCLEIWDIVILHKCTKNHDHMLHCSWDMTHDGHNFYFSFWAIFWKMQDCITKPWLH